LIEKVLPNLYKIEIPLPRNPLKATNSYIIKTGERNLIIDTGMNREACINVMGAALKELEVDLAVTDFFITHMHADHSGLVASLRTDSSKILCSQPDAEIINSFNSTSFWENMRNFIGMTSFPKEELEKAIINHPGYKYCVKEQLDFNIVKEGSTLSMGDYLFECIETPGHTKGHICLYEPNKKILISGDHVLYDITPNISLFSDEENSLQEYLKSLDKIYDMEIELVLPGHRTIFSNYKERINELKHHHQLRANEVLEILKKGPQDAYQVASQMTWDINCEFFSQFPPQQKWFATGEAIAHLKYLEEMGKIQKELREDRIVYQLV